MLHEGGRGSLTAWIGNEKKYLCFRAVMQEETELFVLACLPNPVPIFPYPELPGTKSS